jgi:putative intracellular protease/amidase
MPKIAVVLSPGFADWEYALIGGTGGPFYGLDVRYYATSPGELRSQGGLVCSVDRGVEEIAAWEPDAVVVVGGTAWETDGTPDIRGVLRTQRERGGVVAGICGGTLALARAGLLNDVAHTSNEATFLTTHAAEYDGAGRYKQSAVAVTDGGIVTAPGTALVSFTAAVFAGVGLDPGAIEQFQSMMAAEHGAA